jgi:hypothetical protein
MPSGICIKNTALRMPQPFVILSLVSIYLSVEKKSENCVSVFSVAKKSFQKPHPFPLQGRGCLEDCSEEASLNPSEEGLYSKSEAKKIRKIREQKNFPMLVF